MAKYIYPAILEKEGAFYNVNFPDLENCYTQGETLEDAYEMAEDILCLTLYNLEENGDLIPEPSDIKSIKINDNQFTSLVACDTLEYRQYYDNKAIKKTLTIPSWLNKTAEREGVNFSALLQSALKHELNITDR